MNTNSTDFAQLSQGSWTDFLRRCRETIPGTRFSAIKMP